MNSAKYQIFDSGYSWSAFVWFLSVRLCVCLHACVPTSRSVRGQQTLSKAYNKKQTIHKICIIPSR